MTILNEFFRIGLGRFCHPFGQPRGLRRNSDESYERTTRMCFRKLEHCCEDSSTYLYKHVDRGAETGMVLIWTQTGHYNV